MKIGIACGGTGGHIFPGLATAEVLRERGHEVTLWLGGKDIEKKSLGGWTSPVITIQSTGLPSRPGIKYFNTLVVNWRAFLQCRRQMRLSPPNVFLAMGGYASVAPAMAAISLSIPVVLHEANVIPGRANRFLSRWAKVFALGFEETRSHIRHRNIIYTGIPLRKTNAENAELGPDEQGDFNQDMKGRDGILPAGNGRQNAAPLTRTFLKVPCINADWSLLKPGVFTILAMGGSRGASALNEIVAKAVVSLHAKGKAVQIIHLTGTNDENNVRKTYLESGVTHLVFAFLHNMDQAYGQTSLAICRAGGSTCAEIAKYGVPALLIPYPHAASNHQLANARACASAGAADVLEEKNCTADRMADYISELMTDNDKLQRMKNAAFNRADKACPSSARNAASALADLVLSITLRT